MYRARWHSLTSGGILFTKCAHRAHRATDPELRNPTRGAAAALGLTQKFDMPLMLSPSGRLAALKKPGWPTVSRFALSCEYDKKTAASKLTPPKPTTPGGIGVPSPGYTPKPTLNVSEMLFVNVASR